MATVRNRRRKVASTRGQGRNGTPGGNNSGDIFLAFSTANPIPRAEMETGKLAFEFLSDNDFDPYYLAAVEATEEAIINAMLAADDFETLKPAGKTCAALRPEQLLEAVKSAKCSNARGD